jgi:hypothetical protein
MKKLLLAVSTCALAAACSSTSVNVTNTGNRNGVVATSSPVPPASASVAGNTAAPAANADLSKFDNYQATLDALLPVKINAGGVTWDRVDIGGDESSQNPCNPARRAKYGSGDTKNGERAKRINITVGNCTTAEQATSTLKLRESPDTGKVMPRKKGTMMFGPTPESAAWTSGSMVFSASVMGDATAADLKKFIDAMP